MTEKHTVEIDGREYTIDPNVETYLYRGLMGKLFSRGLDNFNDMYLHNMGNVLPYTAAREITKDILRRHKKTKTPTSIIVVGHSLGAAEALRQCNEIATSGTGVKVLACVLLDYVPRGCKLWHKPMVKGGYRCKHYYTSDFRVVQVRGADKSHFPHLTHIELDDDPAVQRSMVNFIENAYQMEMPE